MKKIQIKTVATIVVALFMGLIAAGCGGGGGGGAPGVSRSTGRMTVHFEFPRSAQARSADRAAAAVPDNTTSIVITVESSGMDEPISVTLTPDNDTATIEEIPAGRVKVTLMAYADYEGESEVVASRIEYIDIAAGETSTLDTVLGISITDDGAVPSTLYVDAYERIVWVNNSSHNITIDIPGTDCHMTLGQLGVLSCTFTSAGSYSYTDVIAPSRTGYLGISEASGTASAYANASASRTKGEPGMQVRFMASGYIPGASSLTYQWDFGDGSTSSQYSMSTSQAIGDDALNTIEHAYSAQGTYIATLTVSDGTTSVTRDLRIYVDAASSSTSTIARGTEPTAAKNILFGQTDNELSESELDTARAELLALLETEPNNAEALFLMGLVSLMDEADRLYDVMDESIDNGEAMFPFTNGTISQVSSRAAAALVPQGSYETGILQTFAGRSAGVTSGGTITEDSDPAELQAELMRVIGALEKSEAYLDKASSYLESNSSDYFTIPRDIFDADSGLNYYIDEGDLQIITGLLEHLLGFAYAATAYDMYEGSFDWSAAVTDSDSSGYYEPDEYLPTGDWGTLRSDGAERLTKAKAFLRESFTTLTDGIDTTLAETSDNNELIPVRADELLREELKSIKNGLLFIDDMISVDMSAESNLSDVLVINLAALFDTPASDWKALAPDCLDPDCAYFKRGADGIPTTPDETFSGLIPDGIPDSFWTEIDDSFYCQCYEEFDEPESMICWELPTNIATMVSELSCPLVSDNADTTGSIADVTGLSGLLQPGTDGLSETEFQSAQTDIMSYLSSNPDDADANMAAFIVAALEESEAWAELMDDSSTFPFTYDFSDTVMANRKISKATAGALESSLSAARPDAGVEAYARLTAALPRIQGRTVTPFSDPENPTYAEYKREAETFALSGGTADTLLGYLNKVITHIGSNSSYTFDIPADNQEISTQWITIDAADIYLLKGALEFVQGMAYYGLAYDWTGIDADDFDIDPDDPAHDMDDGVTTPSEYMPASPFGELTTSSYITTAKSLIENSLDNMLTAVDLMQAETTDVNELIEYNSFADDQLMIDETEYALKALKAMLDGVQVALPAEEIVGADSDLMFLTYVDLSALFDTPPSDWKALGITYNSDGSYTMPDSTFSGLFPNGFPESVAFDQTGAAYYRFYITWEGQDGYAYPITQDMTVTMGGQTATIDDMNNEAMFSNVTVNGVAGAVIQVTADSAPSQMYRQADRSAAGSYYGSYPYLETGATTYVRVFDLTAQGFFMYDNYVNVIITAPDAQPPSYLDLDVTEGTTFAGTPVFYVDAEDVSGVDTFDLYIDDSLFLSQSASVNDESYYVYYSTQFMVDTTTLSNGSHTVYVTATDVKDNATSTESISFSVDNTNVGSISGTVSNSTSYTGLDNMYVFIVDPMQGDEALGSAEVNSTDGTYTLSNVLAGAYTVYAFKDLDEDGSLDLDYGLPQDVCGQSSSTVQVTVGGSVTGVDIEVSDTCYNVVYSY